MTKGGVGFLLCLTAAIALGAVAQDYRLSTLIDREQAAGRAFEQQARDVDAAIVGRQSALQASVAAGQTPTDWLDRAAHFSNDIDAALTRLREAAADTDTLSALDTASASAKTVAATDAQVRSSLDQGDRLRAADLIFLDAAAADQKMHDALADARARNGQLVASRVTRLSRLHLALTGLGLVFVLAVAIYFGRAATILARKAEPTTAQMLRDLRSPDKSVAATGVAGPPAIDAPAAAPVQATAPSAALLAAAADLCVDLAKVTDGQDVPGLLQRAAAVLDAKGVVLWAVDLDGARLHPALAHGYSDKVLARLHSLQIDSDNLTALAFRSLEPQSVTGAAPLDPAAVAIPLLTGTGCVGVMAIELRHPRPAADLLPLSRIVGAQLSTLIAPPQESAQKSVQTGS